MGKIGNIIACVLLTSLFILITLLFCLHPAVQRKFIYPNKYEDIVLEYSGEYELSPHLVFAVIKTESNFNKFAKSEKGAKGLMQITDDTAKYIAKKLNVETYDIYSPNDNIRFGCFYLRYLLNRFSKEKTALCAYNAGEGNVLKWLKKSEYSKDGDSLIIIPFKETDVYIKKIYKSYAKYKKLYGDFLDKRKKFE